MKIQPDQVTALNQGSAAESTRKIGGGEEGSLFENVLARELGGTASRAAPVAAPPLTGGLVGMADLLQAEEVQATGNLSEKERAVMDNVDVLLNKWEDYADQLASGRGGSGLKQAYGTLENIESGVKKLKDEWPAIGQDSPGLGSLVNELEVMAVTEKIKFNRGDYL